MEEAREYINLIDEILRKMEQRHGESSTR